MARLGEAYRRKLPERIAELEGLVREARGSGGRARLEEARDLAHTLKGASGTFGLDETSADLEEIWQELEARVAAGATGRRGGWGAVERALGRIRARLETEPPPA